MTIREQRAYDRIVHDVEQALAQRRLTPGDHLSSERELMNCYRVARSTVREALRVLESKELVQPRPGDPRGPLVLGVSSEPVKRSLALLTSAPTVRLSELVQFRMIVDPSAHLLAAAHHTDNDLMRLERNIARMRASIPDGHHAFSRLDLEFHDIIADASDNTLIQACGGAVRDATLHLIESTLADAHDRTSLMRQSVRHHTRVFEAIRNNDGHTAARLARESLYAYYADHVDHHERTVLADLAREVHPQWRP